MDSREEGRQKQSKRKKEDRERDNIYNNNMAWKERTQLVEKMFFEDSKYENTFRSKFGSK